MGGQAYRSFYETWGERELTTDYHAREKTLLWKAQVMGELVPEECYPETMLEVGCAEGTVLAELGRRLGVKRAYGLDLSTRFIEDAHRRFPHIHFLVSQGESIPLQSKAIDLAICSDVLEHVPNPSRLMMELRRVARYAVFKMPIERSAINSFWQHVRRSPGVGPHHGSGHLRDYTARSAIKSLESGGFRILKHQVVYPPFEVRYAHMPANELNKHPSVWLDRLLRHVVPAFYVPVLGGNLFAFCRPTA